VEPGYSQTSSIFCTIYQKKLPNKKIWLCISTGIVFIASSIFRSIHRSKRAIKNIWLFVNTCYRLHSFLHLLRYLSDKTSNKNVYNNNLCTRSFTNFLHLLCNPPDKNIKQKALVAYQLSAKASFSYLSPSSYLQIHLSVKNTK
jgi:hypothetical protein